jgi:hypothetical protein
MLPNFIIGGAQKAGTTSLHWRLKSHPDVFIPDLPQEIHFFDDDLNFARGIGWYEELFSGWSGQPCVGQTSPRYLYDPQAPARIQAALPDVKLVFTLRNPVERAYSQYWHSVKVGFETLSFEAALEREPERIATGFEARRDFSYVDRGRYAEQLLRYLERFPRERILVLTGGERAETADARCAEFLGIDASRFPPRRESARESNAARLPRLRFVQRLTRHIRDRFPHAVAAVDRLNLRNAPYPPMAPATRTRLVESFAPEIERLERILGTDLSHWR